MNVHRIPGARPLAVTAGAAAALAIGLAAAGPANPAGATQSPSARVANDTLTVVGTSHNDRIALRLAPGAPGTMQVDLNDDGTAEHSFDRNTFSRVEVFTRSQPADDAAVYFRVRRILVRSRPEATAQCCPKPAARVRARTADCLRST